MIIFLPHAVSVTELTEFCIESGIIIVVAHDTVATLEFVTFLVVSLQSDNVLFFLFSLSLSLLVSSALAEVEFGSSSASVLRRGILYMLGSGLGQWSPLLGEHESAKLRRGKTELVIRHVLRM